MSPQQSIQKHIANAITQVSLRNLLYFEEQAASYVQLALTW